MGQYPSRSYFSKKGFKTLTSAAAFSLLLPVLAAVLGYFLMPEKESLQVLGILLGFGLTAAIVTIISRFMPPAKSQIEKVI